MNRGGNMAGFQEIPGDGLNRGRPWVKAYRITSPRQGARGKIVLQLSARRYPKNAALACWGIVDGIERARALGVEIPPRTWAEIELYPDFKRRLAEKGLIPSKSALTLAELWARYIQEQGARDNWKQNTIRNKGISRKAFFEYFKEGQSVETVTKQQAQAFKNWLASTFTESTAAGYLKDAKAAFNWAVGMEFIEKTPFEGIAKGSFMNKERETYISLDTVEKLLTACPSQEWRVVLLLYRRAGLRRDEPKLLKWGDIDFEKGLMTVYSPKTERHKGKEKRVVPLFPDIKAELEALRDLQGAPSGEKSAFVVPGLLACNLYMQFKRIVKKAGLEAWERLIQNLRSSAAIDINGRFGAVSESEWLGHGTETARKHYLHTPPAIIEQARQWNGKTA